MGQRAATPPVAVARTMRGMATITKRGDGWQAKVRRRGYPTYTSTHDTRQQAEAWATSVEADLGLAALPAMVAADRLTLHDALERYRVEITPAKKGAKDEGYRIRAWLARPLAQRTLSSLRGADFAAYRDRRLRDVKPATVRLELALISNVFTVCAREWGLEGLANPIRAMKLPRPGKGRERRLRPGEEALLLEHAGEDLRRVIVWAIETGMRRGEIARLRWSDVSVAAKIASLRDTKNGSARTVPLSSRALAVWPGDGFELSAATISKYFADCCEAAGIDDLHFHDLRHEATSRLFELGTFNVIEIAMITGHKDLAMLNRYAHLSARSLVERLG